MRFLAALLLSFSLAPAPAAAHPICDLIRTTASLIMIHRQTGTSLEETREAVFSHDFRGQVALMVATDLLINEAWRIRIVEGEGLAHAIRSFADYHHAKCLILAR